MKNLGIHLWFVINLAVTISLYAYPSLIKSPLIIIIFASNFLIKSKKEVREEYTKDQSWGTIAFCALLIGLLILSAVSGFTSHLNSLISESNTKIFALIMGSCLLLGYGYLLLSTRNDNPK